MIDHRVIYQLEIEGKGGRTDSIAVRKQKAGVVELGLGSMAGFRDMCPLLSCRIPGSIIECSPMAKMPNVQFGVSSCLKGVPRKLRSTNITRNGDS